MLSKHFPGVHIAQSITQSDAIYIVLITRHISDVCDYVIIGADRAFVISTQAVQVRMCGHVRVDGDFPCCFACGK